MRITNKIIQNNALTNINNNKILKDKLNSMISTEKKITRPSDDPVVAIRALRLRTNLANVNQYYEKNVPDAKSWMSVTEDAIDTTTGVISDIYDNCTKGAQGSLTATDRLKVLENMKALRDQIYATGDADYAGRYVFSGYRTDSSLMFGSATTTNYSITEQLDSSNVTNMNYVDIANLGDFTESNASTLGTTQQDISSNSVHRIRLAYDNCSTATAAAPTITYYDTAGVQQTVTAAVKSVYDTPTQYLSSNWAPDAVTGIVPSAVFLPETGELILNDTTYAALQATKDTASTAATNEGKISVTYEKNDWAKGDLKPEHFFYCKSGTVEYNADYLTDTTADDTNQAISYDVGLSQAVQVNTLASEVFSHDVGRDVDELVAMTESLIEMEETQAKLEKMVTADPTNTNLKECLDAVTKAQELLKTKMQKSFEGAITTMQGYLDKSNLALTNVGSRTVKLDLVENRLKAQQANFETLQSENEDVDITEAAVQLSSVKLSYDAALMATSKITQTTLLSYL